MTILTIDDIGAGICVKPCNETTPTGAVGVIGDGVSVNTDGTQSIPNVDFTLINHSSVEFQDLQNGLKFWLGPNLNFTPVSPTGSGLTATAHDMVTGDGPLRLLTTGTLPSGYAEATKYWVIRVDDNQIRLAASYDDAIIGNPVNYTDQGTGTHTLERAPYLVIPGGSGITRVALTGLYAWAANSVGQRVLRIVRTGLGNIVADSYNNATDTLPPRQNVAAACVNVVEGDSFRLTGWQNSGVSLGSIASNNTFNMAVLKRD